MGWAIFDNLLQRGCNVVRMNAQQIDWVIRRTLAAVDPYAAVLRHASLQDSVLRVDEATYDLSGKDIRLVAVGKAAVPMARAVCELLGERIGRGVVATKYGHSETDQRRRTTDGGRQTARNSRLSSAVRRLRVIESAHPVPDENSLKAGEAICDLLKDCTADTLILVCVSGGASALVVAPQVGISLKTLQAINGALLKSGADIHEMNAVRSRLDRLKGGGLVRLAEPASVVSLILSDVIGDPLEVIASGITNAPNAAQRLQNVLVGNNTQACEAAAQAVRELGYAPKIVTTEMRGEARERGTEIAESILKASAKTALIYGGETTVNIRGEGLGGRNQEMTLAAAMVLGERSDVRYQTSESEACVVIALGTDGTDGPTDAAGAIATRDTVRRAVALGLDAQDFLERNDSYHFFEALGDLIRTGPTGTNVADVVIAIAESG